MGGVTNFTDTPLPPRGGGDDTGPNAALKNSLARPRDQLGETLALRATTFKPLRTRPPVTSLPPAVWPPRELRSGLLELARQLADQLEGAGHLTGVRV